MDIETMAAHVDYPHNPGTLYDCPPCEARMARSNLRGTISVSYGDEDEYGTTVGWHFAIAELLTLIERTDLIPAAWQFRPSPMLSWDSWEEDGYENAELYRLWADGELNVDALTYWGDVLSRYAGILRAAGKDY
jgi:hypothetical protein